MKRIARSNRQFVAFVWIIAACDKGVTALPAPRLDSTSTISGTIRTDAAAPDPIALPENVRKVCGDHAPDPTLKIGPDRALANVVVWVEDAAPTAPSDAATPLIDQQRCAYQPAVVVGHTGGKLKVKNSDPLMHNVRAQELFNVGMPIEGQVIERALPQSAGPVKLVCDVHPWMRADVMVLPHQQWAITDAEGHFTLKGVSPGARPLRLWHPLRGEKKVSVDVPPSGEGKLNTSL
ncbi:MAG: hypothetical protein IPJ65_36035 [Archangiaceae bacterium]|nr:hypothetical protein [Archangiaceae bacterium]